MNGEAELQEPRPSVQRGAFRETLRQAREDRGLSQRALAKALGVTPGAVWQWEREEGGTLPRFEITTEIERVLELEPGRLSRLLGYVPAEAGESRLSSVIESARNDPLLGDSERDLLVAIYRELVRQSAARRSKRSG
jgi:transcriptional regulator with XRE-family HTH domain